MKKELDEALVKDFPNLYTNRHCSPKLAPMCFGFECDNGWHDLIRKLSENIEKEILKLPEETREHVWAAQVKEKFGGLRFYMNGSTKEIDILIDKAEDESFKICEICGKPGEPQSSCSWITTFCPECLTNKEFANKR